MLNIRRALKQFPKRVQGWTFSPQMGGKRQNGVLFSPQIQTPWGENIGLFSPQNQTPWGENSSCFPPIRGENRQDLRNFWENQLPDYRFPFRKSHFQLQNWRKFPLRPLVMSYQIPKIFACGAFTFYVYFDGFSGFIFPPIFDPMGGKLLVSPQIWGVWGENEKTLSPHAWGENVHPCGDPRF